MKIGDTVRFKRRYIREKQAEYSTRANLDDIMRWLKKSHTVAKLSGGTVYIPKLESLGIGRFPNHYRPSSDDVFVTRNGEGECKCEWPSCRKKVTCP